jgi:hypothetical protein
MADEETHRPGSTASMSMSAARRNAHPKSDAGPFGHSDSGKSPQRTMFYRYYKYPYYSVSIRLGTFTTLYSVKKKLDTLQKNLAPLVFEGKDLLCPIASHSNIQQIRELYCLRGIDQIYKYLNKHDLKLTLTFAELEILLLIITSSWPLTDLPKTTLPSRIKASHDQASFSSSF